MPPCISLVLVIPDERGRFRQCGCEVCLRSPRLDQHEFRKGLFKRDCELPCPFLVEHSQRIDIEQFREHHVPDQVPARFRQVASLRVEVPGTQRLRHRILYCPKKILPVFCLEEPGKGVALNAPHHIDEFTHPDSLGHLGRIGLRILLHRRAVLARTGEFLCLQASGVHLHNPHQHGLVCRFPIGRIRLIP